MYEFPKKVKQHRNEIKALAIFLYHLRDFGIVRDIRESDYGIDLEYEFIAGDQVIGRLIKIQLKSVSRINKKNPKIGNIKQSTLNYWAEISYRINTIVVAVNTIKEEICFTFPIFWDAISKIDHTRKTKSIELAKNKGNCEAAAMLVHHVEKRIFRTGVNLPFRHPLACFRPTPVQAAEDRAAGGFRFRSRIRAMRQKL